MALTPKQTPFVEKLTRQHLAVVCEFEILGSTDDATDGLVPHRTWWSGYRDVDGESVMEIFT